MNHHQLSAAAIRDIWASTSVARDHRWHVRLHRGASGQTLQRGDGNGRSLYRLGSVKLIEPIDSICFVRGTPEAPGWSSKVSSFSLLRLFG